jgi:hypothetical protein
LLRAARKKQKSESQEEEEEKKGVERAEIVAHLSAVN